MADGVTANFGFVKPLVGDITGADLWGDKINLDLDNIDAAIFNRYDKATSDARYLQRRNYVENGDFRVTQRGTAPFTGSGIMTYDRWAMSGAGNCIAERNQGPKYYVDIYRTSSGGNDVNFYQKFEFWSIYELIGKTVTVAFEAVSNVADQNLYVSFRTTDGESNFTNVVDRGNITITPAQASGAWTPFSFTFTLPLSMTQQGAYLLFTHLNAPASTAKRWAIRNIQLVEGSYAPPYLYRPIQQEIALCHRHFWRSINPFRTVLQTGYILYSPNVRYPVQMRGIPARVFRSTIDGAVGFAGEYDLGGGVVTNRPINVLSADVDGLVAYISNGAGTVGNSVEFALELNAELT